MKILLAGLLNLFNFVLITTGVYNYVIQNRT